MNNDMWIFLLALHFICVSSNEPYIKTSCEQNPDVCETHRLRASLGSSVLLPCYFKTTNVTFVSWTHTPELALLDLTSAGRIVFLDPRFGRVKAFPNQGSEGNFSISISELKNSDLGCYVCTQEEKCLQVELVGKNGAQSIYMMLLMYIGAAVAAFILLSFGGYCCKKFCCKTTSQYNPEFAVTEENEDQGPFNQQELPGNYCNTVSGALPPPDMTLHPPSSSGIYPNLDEFQRTESLRTKQRFHRELFNRLRQASSRRHYYVNQHQMRQQQANAAQKEKRHKGRGKKKVKDNGEFKNPIYNRSLDQLNNL
ncbi:uncharacterized protein LOC134879780 isoform X2 [Eleginops maclovinus]|uniref:uncharacterized protein LOC134879780 isoform X2 n=1 Tax=Eleginops maclovinus TaxID=56733 RepID=UPI0030807637